ncbi:MAG: PD-(D/E)XK nuclease family protein [Holosporaceae bacterium]|jgi:ATP-dependent helicase/nuclease subunit B|nr:PD-(D/E)XK nuclease family protein [Holosporaceae bacterium]
MGNIYNIPLNGNFLEEIEALIEKITTMHDCNFRVFLPNLRSDRELRKYMLSLPQWNMSSLPQMSAISNFFTFEDQKITPLVMHLLKNKNQSIPMDTLFSLAESLVSFLKELVFNNISLPQISSVIPKNLAERWGHTLAILEEVFATEKIMQFIEDAKARMENFAELPRNLNIIAVGIGDANHYVRLFLKYVMTSKNGVLIIFGSESPEHKNYKVNANLLESIVGSEGNAQLKLCVSNEISGQRRNFSRSSKAIEEFRTLGEEAFAIALATRRAIFENQSVLIVSLQRYLTEKIKKELLRWNIFADDSIGCPFVKSESGLGTSLVINLMARQCDVQSCLDLLKASRDYAAIAQELEEFFRKQRATPPNFFAALDLWDRKKENQNFLELMTKLQAFKVDTEAQRTFAEWHSDCRFILSLIDPEHAVGLLSASESVLSMGDLLPPMNFEDFRIFFTNRVMAASQREEEGYTEGVTILGAIEAQLLDADLVIIAGANEESWSASEDNDFWLTKSMLRSLNIKSVEARNDFLHSIFERLCHKNQVLITRSEIIGGLRQRKCRYLEILPQNQGVIGETADYASSICFDIAVNPCLPQEKNTLQQLMLSIRKSYERKIAKFEAPNPELHSRPRKLWASDVDLLINNPYAFYAKKILGLSEISDINNRQNIRGNYWHALLEYFVKYSPDKTDVNKLNYFAEKILKDRWLNPYGLGLWFFGRKKIFSFIVDHLKSNCQYFAEIPGSFSLQISPDCNVSICARVDRIDINADGSLCVIDYKTGVLPSNNKMTRGIKIQLPIEGLIAQNDGLGLGNEALERLILWKLGGADGGEEKIITKDRAETAKLCDQALVKLKKLIKQYNVLGASYDVNVDAAYDNAYLHLARVKEWHNAG